MRERRVASRTDPIAVIDIGSNSGRVMVFERDFTGQLRLLGGSRAALRLVHDVDTVRRLTEATMARTMDALRDFQAIATRAGATRIVTVATAAMRDASSGAQFAERVRRELGLRVDIIGGPAEARYGFAGAVRGLAVSNGLLFDIGGGSMQITRFARRQLADAVSLPLGALRLSDRFLRSDPPSGKQLRHLRSHVRSCLTDARVHRLQPADRLVGTGGTLRNVAKIDREARRYPIGSLHGYELPVDRLADVIDRLATTKKKRRDEISGLSAERADSIVGGAVAVHALAELVGARHILVSGHGVREGVALRLLNIATAAPDAVKEASLSSLVSRFAGWDREAATRRRGIAVALCRALESRAPARVARAIDHAACVLDIGRSLDVVNRHKHAAEIVLTAELTGFAHDELALIAAVVRRAGDRHADVGPLPAVADAVDRGLLDRAAVILALADEIERRCPSGRRVVVDCDVGRHVTLSVQSLPSWLAKDIDRRFERAFGRSLIIRRDSSGLKRVAG
jgi:exopolyphosphatase / guanosine-5'-triphosphate,3'-diphosphate pyrophosphatase